VEYIRAQRVRTMLVEKFEKFMADWDVIVVPGSGLLTTTNLTGNPQVVVRCGYTENATALAVVDAGIHRQDLRRRVALAAGAGVRAGHRLAQEDAHSDCVKHMNRRAFLGTTAAFGLAKLAAQNSVPDAIKNLRPMTAGVQPITDDERRARIEKARRLMRENKLGAIVMEGGSSLFYFTGTRGLGGDHTFAWVLPAAGEPAWFMPQADARTCQRHPHAGRRAHMEGKRRSL
jgi:hypothetical protein